METIKRIAKFEAIALLTLALGVALLAAAVIFYRTVFPPYRLMWQEMLLVWVVGFVGGTPSTVFIGTPAYLLLSRHIRSRALSISIATILTVISTIAFFCLLGRLVPVD